MGLSIQKGNRLLRWKGKAEVGAPTRKYVRRCKGSAELRSPQTAAASGPPSSLSAGEAIHSSTHSFLPSLLPPFGRGVRASRMPLEFELCPGRMIGGNHPCFIIAEIGQNHQGDVDIAKKMIKMAKVGKARHRFISMTFDS